MPELPDLTVFAESLARSVLNKKISSAEYHRKKRLNIDPQAFRDALTGQKITSVKREGKALLFTLASGDRFLVHLMLSGGFQVGPEHEDVSYAVLTVSFDDGQSLVLFDPRGLATVTFNPKLDGSAVDALEITGKQLAEIIKEKPKITIKELLTDQSVIAGIGNAYSDEILWHAKISPKSIAGKLPEKAVAALASSIHSVLTTATGYLRKTNPGLLSGEVREHLAVHKPKAKLAPSGAEIVTEQVAGKKTYYTEEQTLYE